ncbi:aldehyde dehydrogenase family protein [Pseudarthrobacter sp. NPDC080039]|uniref:aldehyde dehydrogenase family protein n=1 Tax=unclassified Pseudarthrobacter TaxID=2647000 RepID=UPI0034502CB4
MTRITVQKTYKLYIGGAFPRSESGRTYRVADSKGNFVANAALASRKDGRDAVTAARKGHTVWANATPYNRGQVIYRIAEMLEGRREDFSAALIRTTGMLKAGAEEEIDAAIDRLVHYAGWTDKLAAVFGSANPVSGPYFSYSAPEPTGVVAAVAPNDSPLLGLVAAIAPVICSGNSIVLIAGRDTPNIAVLLAETLATSDLPSGVVNILTGQASEIMPYLASHADVNALDLSATGPELRTTLAEAASGTVKRVFSPRGELNPRAFPGTARIRAFMETKTVWHPVGAVSLTSGGSY